LAGLVLGGGWSRRLKAADARKFPVQIQVIRASEGTPFFDEKLEKLEKQFKKLPYNRFELKDEAKFELQLASTVRMQLPNEAWMTIIPKELAKDALRIELIIKKLKFRTTVALEKGGTLAVGGPRYGGGALLLAITRN
jgi:hypothetical protein